MNKQINFAVEKHSNTLSATRGTIWSRSRSCNEVDETCGRVVCRAAQLADGVREVDLPQLELSLHADSGRTQVADKLVQQRQEGLDVWTGDALLHGAPRLDTEQSEQ